MGDQQGAAGTDAEGDNNGSADDGGTPDNGQQGNGNGPDSGKDDGAGTPKTYSEDDVRKLRDEAASRRTALRTAEQERDQHRQAAEKANSLLDKLRTAFGLDGDANEDPKTAAEKAQRERDEKDAELRALRVERAAEKAARKAGADVDALLDSRAFATALAKLNPAGDGFAGDLAELVEKTLTDNPRLKAGKPAPPPSSADMTGGGESGQLTREQLKSMTPKQIEEARQAGKLRKLLGG